MNQTNHHLLPGIVLLVMGLFLAAALALTNSTPTYADPGVRYVAPAAQGSDDCSSWDNACTLQSALSGAVSGDEIWVKKGVHYPGTAGDRLATFTLRNGVALYGGFAGIETDRSQRDWQANVTVLSGDIDGNDTTDPNGVVTNAANIVGANAHSVVTGGGTNSTAVLDGFVVTAGQANAAMFYRSGGGMYNVDSSPALTNVNFFGNMASSSGGAMDNRNSSPILANVVFSGNSAWWGGGMNNWENSNPTLTNVVFSNNTVDYDGGGMNNSYSSPTLTNVIFSDNTASRDCGGMRNSHSSPTLLNVTFSGNISVGFGGGMVNAHDSNSTLDNVVFSNNRTELFGGGMYNFGSNPVLTDVTFDSNVAVSEGGGMKNENSSPTLTSVIFSSNEASWGGGITNAGNSNPALTDVTFTNNRATQYDGGGMANGNSSPTLTKVSFSNNTAFRNGGGMSNNTSSHARLTSVTFTGNTATVLGGGVYNYSSNPELADVVFTGNTSYDGAGMANSSNGNPRLTNVSFNANFGTRGGGMSNELSSPTLTNVVFWGNEAVQEGGGMRNYLYSSPTLTNVTFSDNAADQYGGGMYNQTYSEPALINVVLWRNSAPAGQEILNIGDTIPSPFIAYSNIRACGGSGAWNSACGSDGGGNIDADPRCIDAANGNLRLGFGSPAIDTGAPTGCPTTDLDGNPRPNDGNGDEVVVCDMGAYEAGTMIGPVVPGGLPYEFEGQPGVSIEILDVGGRANGELAWLYVDGMGIDHPHATDEMTTGQYWLIRGLQADGTTDASGFLATLTLPHDLPDHTAAHACRFDGQATWDCARSSSDAGSVVRADVTQFSDWTVSDGMPLAVTLGSFTAQVEGDHVVVAWETLSEVDTLGFNLWRGLAADGSDRELLTFVPAQSPGSTQGTVYQVQDAAVQAGHTYWYWLEDIDLGGQTTLYGPVSATVPAPTAVTLAELASRPVSSTATPAAAAAVALLAGLALLATLREWRTMRR